MEKAVKEQNDKTETIQVKQGWVRFIRYCEQLGFGELTRLAIQDGLPVSAERVKKKIRFN